MLPSLSVRKALLLFLAILGACFVFEWSVAWFGTLRHLPYPYTTPLFNPGSRFSDWFMLVPRAKHFGEPNFMVNPAFGYPFQYPLPSIYPFVLFGKLFRHPTGAYVVFSALVFSGATLLFSLALRRRGYNGIFQLVTWATMLLGFPAAILVDRANVEIFLWLGVLLGLTAFLKKRPYLAAVLLAVPACMKIYPAIFFLLFLPRRQYKAFFLGIAATAIFFFATVIDIGPTVPIALQDMAANGKVLRDGQIVAVAAGLLRWDHSLFADEKKIVFTIEKARHGADFAAQLTFPRSALVYSFLVPLAFLALYFLRIRRMPLFNQFAALAVCAVLLPYISYEYTLVYFYLVWACFLFILAQDVGGGRLTFPPGALTRFCVLFALVFAPISALTLEHYGGQVRSLFLLALLYAALKYPVPSTLFGDLAPTPEAGLDEDARVLSGDVPVTAE